MTNINTARTSAPPPGQKSLDGGGYIRRGRPTSHFTTLPNGLLQDRRLSHRQIGIMASILSRPADWRCWVWELSQGKAREGRDAIRTALRGLRALGYVSLARERQADGTIRSCYTVFSDPAENVVADVDRPTPENPATDEPATVNPSPYKRPLSKKERSNNQQKHRATERRVTPPTVAHVERVPPVAAAANHAEKPQDRSERTTRPVSPPDRPNDAPNQLGPNAAELVAIGVARPTVERLAVKVSDDRMGDVLAHVRKRRPNEPDRQQGLAVKLLSNPEELASVPSRAGGTSRGGGYVARGREYLAKLSAERVDGVLLHLRRHTTATGNSVQLAALDGDEAAVAEVVGRNIQVLT